MRLVPHVWALFDGDAVNWSRILTAATSARAFGVSLPGTRH